VLRLVLLPLALPTLLAGVKTAAVINVGTATVAAFVGAGGLGERIVAGLAVNDTSLMLAGAVPAALLALLVQWGFDVVHHLVRLRLDALGIAAVQPAAAEGHLAR
jgi:osmoprotectant transport system permease protein